MKTLRNIIFAALLPLAMGAAKTEREPCQPASADLRFSQNSYLAWSTYAGSASGKDPKFEAQPSEDDDHRVKLTYTHRPGTWAGMYTMVPRTGYAEDELPSCSDAHELEGIRFSAKGNGKLRVQLTEGYEGCLDFNKDKHRYEGCVSFGEVYEALVDISAEESEYTLPWESFKKRKDWQMGPADLSRLRKEGIYAKKDRTLVDRKLDTDTLHTITLETLCQKKDKGCKKGEEREIEMWDMRLYRDTPNHMFAEKYESWKSAQEDKDAGL